MNQVVHIEMLGCFQVRSRGETFSRFRTQRTGALLAYLAYHAKRAHPRDLLADLFWPESDPETARANLRVALNSLRKQLEPPGVEAGSVIVADRISVQLDPSAVTTDVQTFEAALRSATGSSGGGEWLGHLEEAVSSYGGSLLPAMHDDWAQRERDRLSRAYVEAAERLCEGSRSSGDLQRAIRYAHLCAVELPYDDAVHERLVRLLIERGSLVEASERYQEFKTRLSCELGLEPSSEFAALAGSFPVARKARANRTKRAAATRHRVRPHEVLPLNPAHLPLRLTRFYGRETELRELGTLLANSDQPDRILTLTGAAGCGKTRLLIELAQESSSQFPGGVWFVDLSGLTDIGLVPNAISTTLGIGGDSGTDPVPRIASALGSGRALLALDNMEQLLSDDLEETGMGLEAVRSLLALAPNLVCVVTSRRRLGLEGEKEIRIEPLEVPSKGLKAADLASNPSVGLFVDRARLVQPDFTVTTNNAAAVAELSRRLEGVPLAIELAAAWSHSLSPAQITERLVSPDEVLISRRRGGPERHRSLRAALAWSFDLLSPKLTRFLGGLSVFRGGWTVEAAAAVCEEPGALSLLADLRERSLVSVLDLRDAKRFKLLESVREFAAESLDDESLTGYRDRHAAFYQQFAFEVARHLRTQFQTDSMRRLEPEEDNFRAALEWSVESGGEAVAARLMCRSARYWELKNLDAEACDWFERIFAKPFGLDKELTAEATCVFGRFRLRCGADASETRPMFEASLVQSRAVGRRDLEASAIYCIGHAIFQRENSVAASDRFAEALATFEEVGNPSGVGDCLINLGELELRRGNMEAALNHWHRGLAISEEVGDMRNVSVLTANLGEVAMARGDYAEAKRLSEAALAIFESCGEKLSQANVYQTLGRLALIDSHREDARRFYNESLRIKSRSLNRRGNPSISCDLADLDRLTGHVEHAESRYRRIISETRQTDHADVIARFGLAQIAIGKQQFDAAASLLKKCLGDALGYLHTRHTLLIVEAAALCLATAAAREEAAQLAASIHEIRSSQRLVRDPLERGNYDALMALLPGPVLTTRSRPTLSELVGLAQTALSTAWAE